MTQNAARTTLRVSAVVSVLLVFVQFATAGPLIGVGVDFAWLQAHGWGSIVLHVATGIAALAAVALWRLGGAPAWPGVVAAVVFVLTFVQGAVGVGTGMIYHVPGEMLLTAGTVVVAAWALAPARVRTAAS